MSIYPTDDRYEPGLEEAKGLHRDHLAKKYGVRPDHPKLQVLYEIAYDLGHSLGDHEVEAYFADLSVLIKE